MGALGEEWDPLRLHTSRTHIFLQHKNWECYHQEWPACVIYLNYIYTSKRQKYEKNTHTHITTHWRYMCLFEREKVRLYRPLKVVEMTKKRRNRLSHCPERHFCLFFNLRLIGFSAAFLYFVVRVYPILTPQPHLLYICSLPCLSWLVCINNLLLQTVCVPHVGIWCGYSRLYVCKRAHIMYTKEIAVLHVYLWMFLAATCTEVFSCVLLLFYSPLKQPDIENRGETLFSFDN